MRIVVSGGRGFLGGALTAALRAAGHDVMVLTRQPAREGDVRWSPEVPSGGWIAAVEAADVVINLAGEGLADRRWTAARKEAILRSRVNATRAIATVLRGALKPAALLSSSGIGVYGDRGDEQLTEGSTAGTDFLATVCVAWEREARAVEDVTRVVLLRTGVVLAEDGGALPRMALPFRLFVGGPIGSGQQYMSWIHREDWVALVMWVLEQPAVHGPVNVTAPAPVRNRDFASALGRVLGRPSWMPVPAFALRVAVGELADVALLGSQRAVPEVALTNGFQFRYPAVPDALRDIYVRT